MAREMVQIVAELFLVVTFLLLSFNILERSKRAENAKNYNPPNSFLFPSSLHLKIFQANSPSSSSSSSFLCSSAFKLQLLQVNREKSERKTRKHATTVLEIFQFKSLRSPSLFSHQVHKLIFKCESKKVFFDTGTFGQRLERRRTLFQVAEHFFTTFLLRAGLS